MRLRWQLDEPSTHSTRPGVAVTGAEAGTLPPTGTQRGLSPRARPTRARDPREDAGLLLDTFFGSVPADADPAPAECAPAPPSAIISGYLVLLPRGKVSRQGGTHALTSVGQERGDRGEVHAVDSSSADRSRRDGIDEESTRVHESVGERMRMLRGSDGVGDDADRLDLAPRVQLLTPAELGELLGMRPHQLKVEITLRLPRRLLQHVCFQCPVNEGIDALASDGGGSSSVLGEGISSEAREEVATVMRSFLTKLQAQCPDTTFDWDERSHSISHRSLRIAPNVVDGSLCCSWDHSDELLASKCVPSVEQWLAAMAD